jgi:hypothetical protein
VNDIGVTGAVAFDPDYFEKLPRKSTADTNKIWYFPKSDEAYAVKDFEKSAMAYYMDALASEESLEVSTNIINDFVCKTGAVGIDNSEKVTTVYTDLPYAAVIKVMKSLAVRYPKLASDEIVIEVAAKDM